MVLTNRELNMLSNLRDLLRKGWVEEAGRYVNALIEKDPALGIQVDPIPYVAAFERDFQRICQKHNIIGAYLALEVSRETT